MKILVIEDDENIVDYINNVFQIGWPKAKLISTHLGQKGIEIVGSEAPDVILLDLGLPDIDGFEVLKQIRLFSSVPIIILTVRGEEHDVVKGLGLGADEYVVKPFRQLELLARVRALTRRQKSLKQDLSIVYGPLRFGSSLHNVVYGKREITLTNTEGRILYELMAKEGGVVTPSELAEEIWGQNYHGAVSNIKTYIYRLRQKLKKDSQNPCLILSKPGVGYYLAQQN